METALVVDDDLDTIELISTVLREEGIWTTGMDQPLRVFDAVQTLQPDVLLLDVLLPYLDGWVQLRLLHVATARRHVPVMLFSAWPGALVQPEADGGPPAFATLAKPFAIETLLATVRAALAA